MQWALTTLTFLILNRWVRTTFTFILICRHLRCGFHHCVASWMCRWILYFDGIASIFFNLVSSLMAFSYIFHRAGEEGRQRVWVQTKSGRCCWVRIGGSAGVGSSGESSSSLGRDPVAPEQHATGDTAQQQSRAAQQSTTA